MDTKSEVVLRKTLAKLDAVADLGAGYTASAVYLEPAAMTVDGAKVAWLLVQYHKKARKGSKAKDFAGYWSSSKGAAVSIDWLTDQCAPLTEDFCKGGWAFPLKAFTDPDFL
jgi:hypothetical protein